MKTGSSRRSSRRGRSSRFGSDKALALLDGQPLLRHVADSLQACPTRLLIAPLAGTPWRAGR
ncbi:NTP transferase domain-containing protein [Deinococcus radiopugnans]|uniref:NTP transferase domain-containing protein n=1 Tax=Deinococcus radiopugnans TaxID=57497 RepID=UPI0036083F77